MLVLLRPGDESGEGAGSSHRGAAAGGGGHLRSVTAAASTEVSLSLSLSEVLDPGSSVNFPRSLLSFQSGLSLLSRGSSVSRQF